MAKTRTFTFKAESLKRSHDTWRFINCDELGIFLGCADDELSYRLIEPVARAMIWQHYKEVADPQELNIAPLRDNGIMLASFTITRRVGKGEQLYAAIDLIEKHGCVFQKPGQRKIYISYLIGSTEDLDYQLLLKVKDHLPGIGQIVKEGRG